MKKSIHVVGILSLCALSSLGAQAADLPTPSCDEIRVQIRAQTGLLPQANIDLLRSIGLNQQCQFTAAEVYRGAYGDKPLPVQAPRDPHRSHDHDDD